MNILIIEDEQWAQSILSRLLKQSGMDYHLLAIIETVEESIEWFQNNPSPDLVFLDIQLADGLSFEIFDQVELKAPVIFTTAYDEYAIKAFRLNSIDYLLKPIKLEDLKAALSKLNDLKSQYEELPASDYKESLLKMISKLSGDEFKSRFVIKRGEQILFIETERIAWFKADENVVFLFDENGGRNIVEHTIEQLNAMLDPKQFFRINRGSIVNIKAIDSVHKYFNGRLLLKMNPNVEEESMLVSRKRVTDFIQWLEN